jgi:hypothetical protein
LASLHDKVLGSLSQWISGTNSFSSFLLEVSKTSRDKEANVLRVGKFTLMIGSEVDS